MATKHDIFPLVLPILRWLHYPPHPHIHSFWLTSTQDGDEALKAFLDAQERHQDFVEASLEAVRIDAAKRKGFRNGGRGTTPIPSWTF
jgi:hypothetical protein